MTRRWSIRSTAQGAGNWFLRRGVGPFRRRRSELNRTQWLAAPELERYQLERLKAILSHCRRWSPYYRARFDAAGFDPAGITKPCQVAALPALTKTDVARAAQDIVSRRSPSWMLHAAHTGGTTGTPLVIRRDAWSIGNEHAFVRRQWDWAGIGLRDCCAVLTGRVIAHPDDAGDRLVRYIPLMRELVLSTYHLSDAVVSDYARWMREARAVALVAYPSAALTLAKGCLSQGIQLPLRAVLTSSETLLDEARRVISEAFGCPVFDFYGSAERVCYIHTCEQGSYHIVPEYGYTELMPNDGENEYRIVATGFWNSAMPFVRYDLGDIVEATDRACACGRNFPVVDRIVGRPGEHLSTPSGRRLGAALLTHVLYGAANIRESQLVQDAADHVWFRFVPEPGFSPADEDGVRELMRMHLPSELHVEFQPVDAIARTASGKFRPIINQVDAGARGDDA